MLHKRYRALKTAHMKLLTISTLAAVVLLIGISINPYLYLSYDLLLNNLSEKTPLEINFIFTKTQWISALFALMFIYFLYLSANKIIDSVPVWNRFAVLIYFSIVFVVVYLWLKHFTLSLEIKVFILSAIVLSISLLYALTLWLQDSYMARQASLVSPIKSILWGLALCLYLMVIFRLNPFLLEEQITYLLARNDIYQQTLFGFRLSQMLFVLVLFTIFLFLMFVARATLPVIFSTKSGRRVFIALSFLLYFVVGLVKDNTFEVIEFLFPVVFLFLIFKFATAERFESNSNERNSWEGITIDMATAYAAYGIADPNMLTPSMRFSGR